MRFSRHTLTSAVISIAVVASARAAPTGATVLVLKDSQGRPSIDLRIDGKGPFRFLFDTGSGADLIINQDLAEKLGLASTGTRRIGDPNAPDAIEAKVLKVDRVDLGALTLRDLAAISWKREVMGMADFPRGVVGLGLFGPRLVTLDYGRGELTVENGDLPEPDGQEVLEASFTDGIPSVALDVCGTTFRAHLDSGSTGFVGLPIGAAKSLPLEAPPVVVGRARTASGDYAVSEARLEGSVRLGAIVIDDPRVRFVDLPIANLGFDLLRSLIVTIDRKNDRVRLVSAGVPLRPTERIRLGVVLSKMEQGRLPVDRVVAGSPAAIAGVRAGDRIVRLNGKAVASMHAYELSVTLEDRPLTITLWREGKTFDLRIGAATTGKQKN